MTYDDQDSGRNQKDWNLPASADMLVVLVTTFVMVGALVLTIYSYFGSREPGPSAIVYPIHAAR